MIRAFREPADWRFLEKCARESPGIGPCLWADAALLRQNPALPYRFYRVGRRAALQQTGGRARLIGPADSPEELASFLNFTGVQSLVGTGFAPLGWQAAERRVLRWRGEHKSGDEAPGRAAIRCAPLPGGADFLRDGGLGNGASAFLRCKQTGAPRYDRAPAPGEVTALLWEGGQVPPAYYSGLCLRLNHGFARLLALREGESLAACAGALCLSPWEVYLSAVYTRKESRGKGYASALVRRLCREYGVPGRMVTLQCLPALVPFYEKLGFGVLKTVFEFSREGDALAGGAPV